MQQKESTPQLILSVTAVIVLYQRTPQESEAFASLLQALGRESFPYHFTLILYDNSSRPHPAPLPDAPGLKIEYVHDPANGGLAPAYNHALHRAEKNHSDWLLLFDQDTTLTSDYFKEMAFWMDSLAPDPGAAAIVPKLLYGERIYSPERDFFFQIRHHFPLRRNFSVDREAVGLQSLPLNAYNSAAAVRVAALSSIGGFPEEFWLDYLDHAVFHALAKRGFRICVMRAELQQKLSHIDLNQVPAWRHRNVLAAQSLFVTHAGTLLDRLFFRLWLLRKSRRYRLSCRDQSIWKAMVMQALLLRTPSSRTPAEPPRTQRHG